MLTRMLAQVLIDWPHSKLNTLLQNPPMVLQREHPSAEPPNGSAEGSADWGLQRGVQFAVAEWTDKLTVLHQSSPPIKKVSH